MSAKVIPFPTSASSLIATASEENAPTALPKVTIAKLARSYSDGVFEQFTIDLSIARGLWRKYPQLVKQKQFPEPFRSKFISSHDGEDPDTWIGSEENWDLANNPELLAEKALEDARDLMRLIRARRAGR